MNAQSDLQLLCSYVERRSEAAFAELVHRHIDFVHSAAIRMVNDPHLAKDVTQGVFIALAKDAGKLKRHPVLSGWIHRTTRNIASNTVRSEVRRRTREKEAATMHQYPETDAAWEEIAPHLDAALSELAEQDRDAVLLRYFENKPAHEMAAILGISAEAAQKRVSRAIDRLRENFAKRGVTAGAAGLAGAISANAVQAAPVGLAATYSIAALTCTSATVTSTQVLAMTTLQKTLTTATITVLAGFGIYQTRQVSHLRQEVERLEQQDNRALVGSHGPAPVDGLNPPGLARNSERVHRKNIELTKQNAALQEERDNTRKSLEIKKEQSSFLENITMKLAGNEKLEIPETVPELAVLYGQIQLRNRDFYEKWNGRIPEAGTPEAAAYQEDLNANVTDDATLLKAFTTMGKDISTNDVASWAQFQSMQLYGALKLDESQWRTLDEQLNRIYKDYYDRGLNRDARPDTGLEAWREQVSDFCNKAFVEIQSGFTPQQRSEFKRIYRPDFLVGLNVGGQKPKN